MKKILVLLFVLFAVLDLPAAAISAASAVVMDAENSRILYEKNGFEKRSMASTTKIMTALCALENGDLEDIVTVSKHAANTEGSSIWLEEGEKITLGSLVQGLMLNSGNDAASAIAEHISGSESAFAELMTQKAKEIGANDTQFKNPHGLDAEGHYTTAYDLALITSYAMKNDTFRELVKTKEATIEWEGHTWGRALKNHNKLLWNYKDCDGVKTGYTKKTGRCLVSSATRDGHQLIVVTLNASDDWNDHTTLLDSCFNDYPINTLCEENEHLLTLPVANGKNGYLPLKTDCTLKVRLSAEEAKHITMKFQTPDAVEAPVVAGTKYGSVSWLLDGIYIGGASLVTDCTIPREEKTNPIIECFHKISRKWLNLPAKNDIIGLMNVEEESHETSKVFSRVRSGIAA